MDNLHLHLRRRPGPAWDRAASGVMPTDTTVSAGGFCGNDSSTRFGDAMNKAFIGYLFVWTGLLAVKVPLGLFGDEPARSSLPLDPAPVAHLLGFAVLAFLALAAAWPISRWSVLGLLVVYAVGTELMQALLPWRSAEVADLLLDVAGILLGWAVYRWLQARAARQT